MILTKSSHMDVGQNPPFLLIPIGTKIPEYIYIYIHVDYFELHWIYILENIRKKDNWKENISLVTIHIHQLQFFGEPPLPVQSINPCPPFFLWYFFCSSVIHQLLCPVPLIIKFVVDELFFAINWTRMFMNLHICFFLLLLTH